MISVQELKEKYPHPTSAGQSEKGYCPGGALVYELGQDVDDGDGLFPGSWTLAEALLIANPMLSRKAAIQRAHNIIEAMDGDQDAKTAWDQIEEALNEWS